MIADYLTHVPDLLFVLCIMIATLGGLWRLLDLTTAFNDVEEIMERRNWAYSVQRLGVLLGAAIGTTAMPSAWDSNDRATSILWLLGEMVWIVLAMWLATRIVDWIILPRVSNRKLVLEGSLAVAVVEAGAYLSVGLLLWGSLTGTSATVGQAIAGTVVFFVLGLVVLTAVFWLQELVTPYNLRERLQEGDLSAAIELAAMLVSVGLVVRIGVAGDFHGWTVGLTAFSLTAVISLAVLYAARWLVSVFLIRGHSTASVQRGAHPVGSLVMGVALLSVAIATQAVVAGIL